MIKNMIMIFAAIALFIVFMILFSSCSCMSTPDKEDYISHECYIAMDCMYRLKAETDKSSCNLLIEACRNSLKEMRAIDRLKFCRENVFESMTEKECRMWLNQK